MGCVSSVSHFQPSSMRVQNLAKVPVPVFFDLTRMPGSYLYMVCEWPHACIYRWLGEAPHSIQTCTHACARAHTHTHTRVAVCGMKTYVHTCRHTHTRRERERERETEREREREGGVFVNCRRQSKTNGTDVGVAQAPEVTLCKPYNEKVRAALVYRIRHLYVFPPVSCAPPSALTPSDFSLSVALAVSLVAVLQDLSSNHHLGYLDDEYSSLSFFIHFVSFTLS
jgi:hypothetical protein